jgi:DNA-binding NarL/FixJ family response regulator
MQILMIDDHIMVLEGLKSLLSTMSPSLVIDTASTVDEALELIKSRSYDIVLLDWNLPDSRGDTFIPLLREKGCASRIVVFSGETSAGLINDVLGTGAAGFIPKRYSSAEMLSALGDVLSGQIHIPAAPGGLFAPVGSGTKKLTDGLAKLTPRQMEVYSLAARGLPNKMIARSLSISDETVKAHLSAVYSTLGVKNRTEAVYQASREGIRFT